MVRGVRRSPPSAPQAPTISSCGEFCLTWKPFLMNCYPVNHRTMSLMPSLPRQTAIQLA